MKPVYKYFLVNIDDFSIYRKEILHLDWFLVLPLFSIEKRSHRYLANKEEAVGFFANQEQKSKPLMFVSTFSRA